MVPRTLRCTEDSGDIKASFKRPTVAFQGLPRMRPRRPFFSHFSHITFPILSRANRAVEECAMDAVYLLILLALYGLTHGLVLALERLGAKRRVP